MSGETIPPPRCPNCGNEGPTSGQSFCEVCGDFVDWGKINRANLEAQAAQAAAQAPAPSPAPAGPPAPAPSEPPVTPAPQGPTGTAVDSPADSSAEPPAKKSDLRRRARALLVPLAEPEVAPVLPGRPVPPRPEVRQPMATDESGIVCWNCGVGNRSDRRFCRNCGVDLSLAPAPSAAPGPSWWQRLIAWFRRLGRGKLIALAALIALAILAFPAFLLIQRLLNTETLIPPATVAASVADNRHPATNAFDGVSDSWWGTGHSGNSAGDSLTAGYSRPVNLRAIRITPGVSPRPQDRDQQNRPELIDITIQDANRRITVLHLRLADDIVQQVSTPVNNVMQVTLTVRSAYQSGPDKQVAIAEVELLGTRG